MSSSGGGDVRLRVRAVCVARAAGSVRLREEHVEDNRAHVPRRRRGRQSCRRAMTAIVARNVVSPKILKIWQNSVVICAALLHQ